VQDATAGLISGPFVDLEMMAKAVASVRKASQEEADRKKTLEDHKKALVDGEKKSESGAGSQRNSVKGMNEVPEVKPWVCKNPRNLTIAVEAKPLQDLPMFSELSAYEAQRTEGRFQRGDSFATG